MCTCFSVSEIEQSTLYVYGTINEIRYPIKIRTGQIGILGKFNGGNYVNIKILQNKYFIMFRKNKT